MLIATFNANSIRARKEAIQNWLILNQPDILCIQETKVQDKDFPIDFFTDSNYNIAFSGQKSYNGVAVFSKQKIENILYGFDHEPKDSSRLICAKINDIHIVNTYIPQGQSPDSEAFQYKLAWFKRLKKFFSRHFKPDSPVIWTGDFNVARTSMDVYDPQRLWGHVCFCKQVQDALEDVMEWGFTDIFRIHSNKPGQYTFWDYRAIGTFQRNLGWRLDYIMATAPIAAKSLSSWIDKEPRKAPKPSDHTFLVADFDF